MIMQTIEKTKMDITFDLHFKKLFINIKLHDQYQLRVHITHFSQILRVNHHNNEIVFVLPLNTPPEIWRKTNNISSTHRPRATSWNERSAWFRVTELGRSVKTYGASVKLFQDTSQIDIGKLCEAICCVWKLNFERAMEHLCVHSEKHKWEPRQLPKTSRGFSRVQHYTIL